MKVETEFNLAHHKQFDMENEVRQWISEADYVSQSIMGYDDAFDILERAFDIEKVLGTGVAVFEYNDSPRGHATYKYLKEYCNGTCALMFDAGKADDGYRGTYYIVTT